ncbi:hypothetical protein SHKM778_57630 [Streptomyces sp. KM77-8]|uniref:Response regulatory domain-containing protein n=1 Tax=Streptomyces haneummycinicus TaxID=3074435 RepID=A0AAT9HP44_9ACTN
MSGMRGGTAAAVGTIDVLVVDDDFRVARVHRAYVERLDVFRVVGVAGTGSRPSPPWKNSGPISCCSTCICPICSGWTSSPGCGPPGTTAT